MMAFSPIRTRLTRTSSDLRILSATLLPPSPVLKADELLISSTSGEIPILLEVATQTCDFLPPFREALGLCNHNEEPRMTSSTRNIRNLTCGDVVTPETWMSVEPNRRCTSDRVHAAEPPDASMPAGAASDGLEGVPHSACYNLLAGDPQHLSAGDNCLLPTLGEEEDTGESRDSPTCHPDTTALGSPASSKGNLDGDQSLMLAAFHTYSTLPTPTFAPPSASPSEDVISPSSSPTWRQRHHRPLERARAVRFPGRPKSPRLQVNDSEARFIRNAPASPAKYPYPRWQLADSPMTSTVTYSCLADTVYSFVKHVALPEELWWLKHTIIELWIDQEGFRAVRPRMHLIGYSPRTRSLHPYEPAEDAGVDTTAGVAEFMPTRRETFAFHYATLDSSPVLRTVSVAGDESRDYVSRHASLSIKVNGVYTVLGTEAFVASMQNCDAHGPRFQNMRLRWKFDYLVSDRKVDGTGRTLAGEKTLTPLTFSCSPYIFHPSQGKKTGLMHIVKKNLVPKLGSQKLEPPTHSSGRGAVPHVPVGNGREAATHARSHSDAFTKGGHYSHARSALDVGMREITTQRVRRRRASSVGENQQCLGNVLLKEALVR